MNQYIILLRKIWKNKLFTGLNVMGLSIGIAAAWIIFRMVSFENSYDKMQPDNDRIYQLVVRSVHEGREGTFSGVSKGLYPFANTLSGIELITPMYYQYFETLKFQNMQGVENKSLSPSYNMIATTEDIFDLLDYQWLAGNKENSLTNPESIVLTEKSANKYFPNVTPEEVLGRVLVYDDSITKQITGIVKNLDYLNSFVVEEFIPLNQNDISNDYWNSYNSDDLLFIKLNENVDPATVLAAINEKQTEKNKKNFEEYGYQSNYDLLPLAEKHFSPEFGSRTRTVSKNVLNGLIAIAIFLLVLGCINYINLSTAQVPQRAKEIGIRKTLGSTPREIILQFIKETAIITFLATIVAFLISLIAVKGLKEFFPQGFNEYLDYNKFVIFILILVSVITLIAGIYPAWIITKLKTVSILKGQVTKQISPNNISLRKGLIVFQFIIAQFFIICSLIVGQQLRYTLNKDLGFNKDAIITFNIPYEAYSKPAFENKNYVLKNNLKNIPEIQAISLGDKPMSNNMLGYILDISNDTGVVRGQVNVKYIDDQFLDIYNIKLLAGRNVMQSDSNTGYLINETALKKFGFNNAETSIGQTITNPHNSNTKATIVGVVNDFHIFGFKSEIEPTTLVFNPKRLNSFNIKLPMEQPDKWQDIIQSIQTEWNNIYAGFDFNYSFYDSTIEAFYVEEKRLSKLIKIATGVSIFISCLGLFGLSTITIVQRAKEIGIRKVLGASISEIVKILSKEFVVLISVAFVIATPIAWWMMNQWLNDYVFRIEIQWWIFVVAGFLTILFAIFTVSFQSFKAAIENPIKSLRDE